MRVSRSLTIKQMAMVSTVAVVFIFIFIVVQLFHFVAKNRYETASQMESIARSVRAPLSEAILQGDIPQAESILNHIQPVGLLSRADVVLPNQFQALRVSFTPERSVPVLVARLFEIPVQISLPLYSIARPANPQPLAYLVLQADSLRLYNFIINTLSTLLTTYLLLALILSVAISWCINRLIVHPLRDIAYQLNKLSPRESVGHQLKLPTLHQDDEIGMLVRSYNRNQRMVQRHVTKDQDVLSALKNRRFAIWLQPQVDMRTGEAVCAEVLLRIQQPNGSWSMPDGFIENIDNPAQRAMLSYWALEESCRALSAWRSRGITMPLSVNLSALKSLENTIVPSLVELLARYKIEPTSLIIEVSESHHIDSANVAVTILRPLQQAGVRIALDNFGMGYASLRHLKHLKSLPIDTLKIDKSFIDGLPQDGEMASLIITMAKKLKLNVVAEGVEQISQRDWLLAEGVNIAQGGLFYDAVSLTEFEKRTFPSLQN